MIEWGNGRIGKVEYGKDPETGLQVHINYAPRGVSRVKHSCRFGVDWFCRLTSVSSPRCWAALVR